MTTLPNKPSHVALFLANLGGGGAERVTLNLARGLQAHGLRVDLVVGKAEGSFLNDVPTGVRLIDLNQQRSLFSVWPLARYLRRERPEVLLSALNHTNVVAILASSLSRVDTRVVVANHVHLTSALARIHPVKRHLFRFLIRHTFPRAHAIIHVSEGVAADLASHLRRPHACTHIMGNPVVDQNLLDKARQPVQHAWLTTRDRPTIVAVGSLIAVKDYPLLLRAMALLKQTSSARLIILGEGEQRGALQQLIGQLGLEDIVDLPGFAANPYGYMSRAAVVVLSSRWEALPTVLIEAMACGTPIVSTDCPCGPSEILEGGKYGRLVPVGDAPAMAAALLDALQGKVPAPPPASWKRFSLDHATGAYLNVFELVTGKTIRREAATP